tara:strand:- start:21 stop:590 length:570 start_codon:yes stop_codon:yes gene_type:complete
MIPLLENIINTAVEKRVCYWKNSPFEDIRELSNDERGNWGEAVVHDLFDQYTNTRVEWNENVNTMQQDGIYDMKINSHRVEIKTSFGGHSSCWQHENIYRTPLWDKCIFVDVDRDSIYFTCMSHSEMTWDTQHPQLKKKATLRKAQDDKWKFDFSRTSLKNGLEHNLTRIWDLEEPDAQLINWWESKFA